MQVLFEADGTAINSKTILVPHTQVLHVRV
jgi:hypothetical protein